MRSTVIFHWAAFFWADVTRSSEWQTEQRCCKSVCPSAVEPLEDAGVDVLDPHATRIITAKTIIRNKPIIEVVRLIIN
jgi:hypothetical protein